MQDTKELGQVDEDALRTKQGFQQFLERFEAAKSQEKETLSCVFPTEYSSVVRIKELQEWPNEMKIKKINDCLAVLRSIKLTGVRKLVIGPCHFQGKISRDLRLEFINNLQNIEGLEEIQIEDYQRNNINPHLFLLFCFFFPTQIGQNFVYTCYSKGRKFLIESAHSMNGKVKQVISFNEPFNQKPIIKQLMSLNFEKIREYEKDLTVSDLQDLNFQLWQIIKNENTTAKDNQKTCDQSQQEYNKKVEIIFNLENSHLRELLECSKDLLRVINADSIVQNVTLKIKESFVFQGIPKEQIQNFSFRDIEELPIISKLCLQLNLLTIDYKLIAELMHYIKGITIINQGSNYIPENSSLLDQIQKQKSNLNVSENLILFQNLKVLEIGELNLSLDEARMLFKQFPNLIQVGYKNYEKIQEFFNKESVPCIAYLINSYSSLNLCDTIFLKDQNNLFFTSDIQFNSQQLNQFSSILLLINKPIFLGFTQQRKDDQLNKANLMKFLSQAAFNPLVMFVRIDHLEKVVSDEYLLIISKIKSLYPLLMAYDKLLSPFMTYNPRHVILDLFVCDDV